MLAALKRLLANPSLRIAGLQCWIPELKKSFRIEYLALCDAYSSLTTSLNFGDLLHDVKESDNEH